MDKKLAYAINRGGKAVLEEFVNIDPNHPWPGLPDFVKRYGPLVRGLDGIGEKPAEKARRNQDQAHPSWPDRVGVRRYLGPVGHEKYLHLFRGAWMAKTDEDRKAVADFLGDILNRKRMTDVTPPRLSVDHRSFHISIVAETLLDLMAKWLIESPAWQLGTCELQGCPHRYYVRQHPRDRYCSPQCTREADRLKKVRWSRKSRGLTESVADNEKPHADYRGLNDVESEFAPSGSGQKHLCLVPRARRIRWPVRSRSRNKSKSKKGK